ncbi:MAG: amidohydrolase family protein [Vallitaleaceae bacterium]|nr:amidohydrolase family protein [Vallitaleaceae bacterium]
MYDLGIVGGKCYLFNSFEEKNVYLLDGKIAAISDQLLQAKEIYQAEGRLVLPGIIDPHVHFELKGKTVSIDDFYQGSVCAAYGGVTTFIDFLDPIRQAKEFHHKLYTRLKLAEKSVVNYSFHATVAEPENVKEIVKKLEEFDIRSVKLFTTYSDSHRRTSSKDILEFLDYSSLGDFIVMVHAEKDELIRLDSDFFVKDLPLSRPVEAEIREALELAELVEKSKGRLYMVHVSSGRTIEALKKKHGEILNASMFLESCPHYFCFTEDLYEDQKGYLYTLAPPLREAHSQDLLFENYDAIYTIGTDHCAYRKEDKHKELLSEIPLGIGGIEHSFDIMYHLFKEKAIEKMTIHPAIMFGLYPQKGHISVGADADLMIYNPNIQQLINKGHSLSDYTPYEGLLVDGRVESTIVGGRFVLKDLEFLGGKGEYVNGHRSERKQRKIFR